MYIPKNARTPTTTVATPSCMNQNQVSDKGPNEVRTRIKIQDQPSRPRVPLKKPIPKANVPLKAPAIEAAPKKSPIRHCNIWRGYQRVRLKRFETKIPCVRLHGALVNDTTNTKYF